jgi:MscS family membrane protein
MERSGRLRARAVLTFARRAVKIALAVVAGIAVLDSFGIDVTTGIAALGLGGLAIALGAQKTVENIVGSVSVIADEPVRVGDFCRVGDVTGTVEDIGIRSTRIRTNERTRVTIPNGNFASMQIENYTLRDRFLFNPVLNIAADLDADGMERVIAAVREALAAADCLFEGARATFTDVGKSSFDIAVFGWIDVPDFTQSLYLREKLLLDIMRRVAAAGGSFAFPTTSVHLDSATALAPLLRPSA